MRTAILTVLLVIAFAAPTVATPKASPAIAPRVALPTTSGTVELDSLRGKVVLVDFWASWCEPCRKSFPWMADIYRKYADQGFTIVAINVDKDREAAEDFLAKLPAPFVVAFDPTGATAEAFGVRAMPSSFLVGRDGTILGTHAGFDPRKATPWEESIRAACAR